MKQRQMKQRQMKQPRGFTLIELLVVLSLLAVILPMAGGMVYFLLRAQSQSADALREAMSITQLSHVFRSDVHAARSARPASESPAGEGLLLEQGDSRTTEYRAEPNGSISRTLRRGKTIERHEHFRLGTAEPRFQLVDGGHEAALILVPGVRTAAGALGAAANESGIRIAAIVSRDASLGELPATRAKSGPKAATGAGTPSGQAKP
jgi:prepilin-type N-terminal cleavage/methylation domain-containing protein